jgi:hypothetical protein
MAEELGDVWKKAIEDVPDLPDGLGPPELEYIKRSPIKDGETPVVLQKIITEVYVYTSFKTGDMWFGSKTFQDVKSLGVMTLGEAIKIIETRKTRRRR